MRSHCSSGRAFTRSRSMSRPEFRPSNASLLTSRHARIRSPNWSTNIYTPKHSSWLNQIEIWFGTLRSKLTRRGSFPSTTDLEERILSFIDYYNATMARPYNWTYTGRLLCV